MFEVQSLTSMTGSCDGVHKHQKDRLALWPDKVTRVRTHHTAYVAKIAASGPRRSNLPLVMLLHGTCIDQARSSDTFPSIEMWYWNRNSRAICGVESGSNNRTDPHLKLKGSKMKIWHMDLDLHVSITKSEVVAVSDRDRRQCGMAYRP